MGDKRDPYLPQNLRHQLGGAVHLLCNSVEVQQILKWPKFRRNFNKPILFEEQMFDA